MTKEKTKTFRAESQALSDSINGLLLKELKGKSTIEDLCRFCTKVTVATQHLILMLSGISSFPSLKEAHKSGLSTLVDELIRELRKALAEAERVNNRNS